jgi:superfamily II DNA or RNA helicase
MKREEIQKQALDAIKNVKKGSIAVSMGVGKTYIALSHIDTLYKPDLKVLVVAPKKSIYTTWLSECAKFNLEHIVPHLSFSTYLSLGKQSLDYDVVYLDECHNLLEDSHDFWLSQFKGTVIGLTGTPPRYSSSEKGRMMAKYCPILYNYITDDAVNDKILNDYRIIIHYLPLSSAKGSHWTKLKSGKTWATSEYENYMYWSNKIDNSDSFKQLQILRILRMNAMKTYSSKELLAKQLLIDSKEKCILFANTQEQADKLCIHSYHSENPESEVNLLKFKQGIITKLSAVLQLNEGINIPNLKEGIIMHAYGNERKSSQRLGRLLRLNPDETSTIHILCYKNTVDETWVQSALEDLDQSKIQSLTHK